jgi:hypothetical protein
MGLARWLLCGLLFALMVGLALATAGIRVTNTRIRRDIEKDYRSVEYRLVELRRLSAVASDRNAPERLAEQLRELLSQPTRRGGDVEVDAREGVWQ